MRMPPRHGDDWSINWTRPAWFQGRRSSDSRFRQHHDDAERYENDAGPVVLGMERPHPPLRLERRACACGARPVRIAQAPLPEHLTCRQHDPGDDEQRTDPDEDHARLHETLPTLNPMG